jgi:protein-glutamine gamma-glutamyltransferase
MPPLLLGAGLAFWGWQTGVLPVGLAMAITLEARWLVHARSDLTRADFNRVSDLCTGLLLLSGVYQAVANESARAVTGVIQWLPLVLFPLMAAQLYSAAGAVEVAVFFWSQRQRPGPTPRVNLAPAYFGLCLLAASTGNARTTFYAGMVALSVWALWSVRGRGGWLRWAAVVVVATALGWAGHLGLTEAQRTLERRVHAMVISWMRRDVDPSRTTTSLGDVGELKLSDRIVMRVEPGPGARMPALLHQASYNVYHAPSWLAVDAAFAAVLPESDGATWMLRRGEPADAQLTLSAYLPRGRGLLALPHGAIELDRLMVVSLARNRFGAVRVDEGLGLVTYTTRFARHSAEMPPQASDLRVPPREADTIERVAEELGLDGRPPAEVVRTLRGYFLGRFQYSRHLAGTRPGRTALEQFLLVSRSGHCEYFATATTLLLRQAGVPARYAVGYAAHEWSQVEARWVVRARDAHAWALAWIDGAWVEVDTTPPVWISEETGPASAWQSLSDFWEWTTFLFSRWRWSERQDRLTGNLGWLLIPLLALLVWRLRARRRHAPAPAAAAADAARTPGAGEDSEFYRVERRLTELGFARPAGEPLGRWLDAVAGTAPAALATGPLRGLLALHYRYRFDPDGLATGERQRLRAEAEAWLAAHPPARASARATAP